MKKQQDEKKTRIKKMEKRRWGDGEGKGRRVTLLAEDKRSNNED